MQIIFPFLLSITFFLPGITQAQSIHSPLLKGDKAYDMEQYKTAEKQYRVAADRDNGNPQAVYNLANSLYQQGNFEDAGERYLQVAKASKTPLETADALHNLGNALLKQRKYKESVQAYQESLRLRPGDPATKMNLQMAMKRLKEEQQKEKEKQQNQQPQQGQPNQPQDQNQEEKPQNQPDPKQNQPNPPQENQQGQQPPPPSEQQKKQSEQKLKKEEAKRLLETAIGPDDRKNAQKYRAAQQQSKPKGTKKDW